MLRSRSSALVGVRRVTELNTGRRTAGIDAKTAVSDRDKAMLAARVQDLGVEPELLPCGG
jgi:RNA-directed DNA polymerase